MFVFSVYLYVVGGTHDQRPVLTAERIRISDGELSEVNLGSVNAISSRLV